MRFVALFGLAQLLSNVLCNFQPADPGKPLQFLNQGNLPKWWFDAKNGNYRPEDKTKGESRWTKRQLPYLYDNSNDQDAAKVSAKQSELQNLLQELYQAEAAVKMEAGEITRAQEVAGQAKEALEDANDKVRLISGNLQAAQEAAALASKQAQTAHLQLMAHDQLLFDARSRVDAISSKMLAVETELASAQGKYTLTNSSQLMAQQGKMSVFVNPLMDSGGNQQQALSQEMPNPYQKADYNPPSDPSSIYNSKLLGPSALNAYGNPPGPGYLQSVGYPYI